jgi:aryl-alcohol dehydrogenase-like predicted oxidoreductase
VKIGLGAVQFGLDYGISNVSGKPSAEEIREILSFASSASMDLLDTAFHYGDSEAAIGATSLQADFKIITKTAQLNKTVVSSTDCAYIEKCFNESLKRLDQISVHGVLVHQINDLLAIGGERILDCLYHLRQSGLVKKIGVSVYNEQQIEALFNIKDIDIDIVQLPINVFDQQLYECGSLDFLKARNIEIHARSVFLQGLLLTEVGKLKSYFDEFQPFFMQYHAFLKKNQMNLLQGALGYIKSLQCIDYALVGVTSVPELKQIAESVTTLPASLPSFSAFHSENKKLINPLVWLADGAREKP